MQQSLQFLLGGQCPICGLPHPNTNNPIHWCDACFSLLDPKPRCQQCGIPMPEIVEACGECIADPPPWDRLITLSDYAFPLDSEIRRIKHQGEAWRVKGLSKMLATRISNPAPLLVSVPLHWKRRLSRRFNQSDLFAYYLAHTLGCDWQSNLFCRIKATPSQRGLTKLERVRNLQDAFVVHRQPLHQHIAIVDDVVTTGSTVRYLSNLLLENGVSRIDIYCICRTPAPDSN